MTAPLDLAELRALLAKVSPLPWGSDDGHIFSEPLTNERERLIMLRVQGDKSVPHPDRRCRGEPLGAVCSTGQNRDNFEDDERAIVAVMNAAPALLAELEAARHLVEMIRADDADGNTSLAVRAALSAYDAATNGGG